MTPARLALASVRRTLEEIAHAGDGERLRQLLRGRELPALGSGEEPAIQIIQALELPPYDTGLTHGIGRLGADSAKRWLERIEAQNGRETTWSATAHAIREPPPATVSGPDDEPFVYNLLLLASWLPRDAALFEALYACHISDVTLTVLAAGRGRGVRQLRRALCNQQTDIRLKDYWLSLLRGSDTNPVWDTARRSGLLEAWRGILWLPRPTEPGPPLDLEAMDAGLRLLAGTTAGHREAETILRTALRRMVDAIPLDPATWVDLIAPFRSHWPELLQDVAAETWPELGSHLLVAIKRCLPPLPIAVEKIHSESEAISSEMASGKTMPIGAGSDSPDTEKQTISPVTRWLRIRENAYARAQKRDFIGGNPFQDWLDAEEEIDARYVTDFRSVFSLSDPAEVTHQIKGVLAGYGLGHLSVDTLLSNHHEGMKKLAAIDSALVDGSLELAPEQATLVRDTLSEAIRTLQSVAQGELNTDGVAKQVELSVKAVENTVSLVKSLTEALTGSSPVVGKERSFPLSEAVKTV